MVRKYVVFNKTFFKSNICKLYLYQSVPKTNTIDLRNPWEREKIKVVMCVQCHRTISPTFQFNFDEGLCFSCMRNTWFLCSWHRTSWHWFSWHRMQNFLREINLHFLILKGMLVERTFMIWHQDSCSIFCQNRTAVCAKDFSPFFFRHTKLFGKNESFSCRPLENVPF